VSAEGRRRGRPLQGLEPKVASLPCRTTRKLRQRVKDAADRNERSMSQEIEARLYFSFDAEEDQYWKRVATEAMNLNQGGGNGDRN
jgi:hypothetical protein